MTSVPLEQYYMAQLQKGGGNFYSGTPFQKGYGIRRRQKGYGFGGIFRTLLRVATPFVKETAKTVGKEALSSGLGLLSDITSGKSLKSSVKSRAKEVGRNSLRKGIKKAKQTINGGNSALPIKRRAPGKATLVAKRPRKEQHRERDIFDK